MLNHKIIFEESRRIRQEVRQQTMSYIIAAFGLVAGLAWNEAIKAMIERLFKDAAQSLSAKFLYAIGITLVVVVMTMYLARWKTRGIEEPKLKELGINNTEL
jgi:ABC-type phosphate transport system permease subunit